MDRKPTPRALAARGHRRGDDLQPVARRLETLLGRLAARDDVHHAVMAVESLDGAFRWSGARGEAHLDGTPMRTDTPYFIASVDKMFTAVAVIALDEKGRLDLDAPIVRYLPASVTTGLHRRDGVDRTESITVRHLLGHTSGLASYLEDRPKGGRSLVESLVVEGDRAWDVEEVARIVREELRPHFDPQPLDGRAPRIRYCDTNYALLHEIVAIVTGRAYREAVARLVLEPLGLNETWVAGRPRAAGGASEPATLWAGDRPVEIPEALRSLDGIYATLSDQLRFMRALSRGEPFDDPATYLRMQEPWKRFGIPRDAVAARAPSWPIEYGLGLKRFRLPRPLAGRRRMPAVLGHSGSTGSWLFHCPELGVVLAGAIDQVTAGAVPYRFVPRLLAALDGVPAPAPR